MSISLLPLCWALGVGIDRQVSPHSPLRTASLFAAVLWALWIQAPLAFRSTCFGSSPLRGTSTIKVVDVRFRFYLSRRPWELWVSPNCGSLCWGWGLGWGCVPFSPLCLDVRFFLGCPMCGSLPNSLWISFSGNCSPNSCKFSESLGKGESRCLHNLEPLGFA